MGWLITLLVLLLLAVLPLGGKFRYNSDGFWAYLVIGPLRVLLYPGQRKKEKNEKKPKKTADKKTSSAKNDQKAENKSGGSLIDFLPLVKTVLTFLNSFRKKLRVDSLELNLILAGGDPCDLAVNYGKAWAALGNLMPHVERFLLIKKRDINIACDFSASQTLVFADMQITITLGRLLYLAVWYGICLIIDYMKIMNKRKGGKKS